MVVRQTESRNRFIRSRRELVKLVVFKFNPADEFNRTTTSEAIQPVERVVPNRRTGALIARAERDTYVEELPNREVIGIHCQYCSVVIDAIKAVLHRYRTSRSPSISNVRSTLTDRRCGGWIPSMKIWWVEEPIWPDVFKAINTGATDNQLLLNWDIDPGMTKQPEDVPTTRPLRKIDL